VAVAALAVLLVLVSLLARIPGGRCAAATDVAEGQPAVEDEDGSCSAQSGGSGGTCRGTESEDEDTVLLGRILKKLPTGQFYINGSWVDPARTDDEGDTNGVQHRSSMDVIDPSTARSIAQIALGNQLDTDAAVSAAKEAFPGWSLRTSADERRRSVERILEIYGAKQQEMALLVSREMGAPIEMAESSQVGAGTYWMESFLELFEHFEFVRPLPHLASQGYGVEDASTTVLMDPIGVVAMITPWNWPLNQIALKVIPALLVGCTCVLKPSEESPLSALLFAQIVHEAGLPAGVFNLVTGEGPVVGKQLSSHKDVDMVSFTGSTRAGALISKSAADTFKRVALELGGKGANIIFDDVGVDWASDVLTSGADMFYNSGQSCNAASRMLVQKSLYGLALEIAKEVADSTRVNSAHIRGDEHIGPVVSLRQYERIQNYIQSGIDEGAELIAGGLGRPDHLKDSQGYYVRPTVFAGCTRNMTIFQEEIFGPVLCVSSFETEEEAIELANDTPYGLTNYVYSRSGPRRRRVAQALRSGMVEMNDADADSGSPFGGYKASGIGREGGIYGLEEFCEIKAVTGWHDLDDDLDVDDDGSEEEYDEEE